jgi:thioredoxin 1
MSREKKPASGAMKGLIVVALAAIVGVAIYAKNESRNDGPAIGGGEGAQSVSAGPTSDKTPVPADAVATLPRLVDLGAGKCIPCKAMAPILEELKAEYADTFEVEFIDVWENPEAKDIYGIDLIPTQIFYDAQGNEQFRHEGFFGKEDILGKWRELGVDLAAAPE